MKGDSGKQETVANSIASWRLIRLKGPVPGLAVTSPDQFIRDLGKAPLIQELIVPGATLALYGYHAPGEPPSFAAFLSDFDKLDLPTIPTYSYVIIVRMDDDSFPWYAMPFGHGGIYLLIEDALDIDASREIATKLTLPADPTASAHIRQLGTTIIGSRPMRQQKRATGDASLGDFNFDRFSEILNDIDAKPENREKYGSSVRAGNGVGLSKRITLQELPQNVRLFEEAKAASDAKAVRNDTMHPVKDVGLVRRLDEALVAAVKDEYSGDVTFSIPDFIYADEWATMKVTLVGKAGSFTDDLDITTYRTLLKDAGKLDGLDVDYLKRAEAVVGEEKPKRFRIYNCLSAEIALNGETFVHHERNWYVIPSNILEYIDQHVDQIEAWNGGLPLPHSRLTEPAYNKTCDRRRFLYLDTATEAPVRGQKPLEICDLLTIDDDMLTLIHVKRDFKSSTLSHLFNQGRASALMMLEATPLERFRQRLTRALAAASPKPQWSRRLPGFISDSGFSPRKTRVVFALLGSWHGKKPSQRLPFMSKLNLAYAARELRGRQFEVRITPIEMAGPRQRNRISSS